MAALTLNQSLYSGLNTAAAYQAAAAAQTLVNDGKTYLHIKNTGAEMTLTLVTDGTANSHPISDTVITVAATTGEQLAGPFPTNLYNVGSTSISLTWSRTSSVTVMAFKG